MEQPLTMDLKLKQSFALAKVIRTKVKVLRDSIIHCIHYMINDFRRASLVCDKFWRGSGQWIKDFTLKKLFPSTRNFRGKNVRIL